jgi:hypothetical protein
VADSADIAVRLNRSIAIAAAVCSVVGISLLFGRAWPWIAACLALELLGLGLAAHYVDRYPGDRRWLGLSVVVLAALVLIVTVVLLTVGMLSSSLSSMTPP